MKTIHVIIRQDRVFHPIFEEIYIDRDGKVQKRAADAVADFLKENQLQIVKESNQHGEWVLYAEDSEEVKADNAVSAYGVGE